MCPPFPVGQLRKTMLRQRRRRTRHRQRRHLRPMWSNRRHYLQRLRRPAAMRTRPTRLAQHPWPPTPQANQRLTAQASRPSVAQQSHPQRHPCQAQHREPRGSSRHLLPLILRASPHKYCNRQQRKRHWPFPPQQCHHRLPPPAAWTDLPSAILEWAMLLQPPLTCPPCHRPASASRHPTNTAAYRYHQPLET